VPAFGSASTVDAFRTVAALDIAPDCIGEALDFLEMLPLDRHAPSITTALALARHVVDRRIDHLHAHFMTIAAQAAHLTHILTRIPYSVTAHAKDVYRDGVDPKVFRRIASHATAIVTVCEANRRYITDGLLAGCDVSLEVVYNGLDLDALPPPRRQREPRLIVAVGRLVEKKGFHVLVDACALLRDRARPFRCVIIGDGEERETLAHRIAELRLGASVELLGSLPRAEVVEWMGRARAVALPCVTGRDGNRDALPTVLLEALALGTPAVSTPVAGVPEIVADGVEGYLVDEHDPDALADRLDVLLTDSTVWSRMSVAGPRTVAARFDRQRTLPQLIDVFERGRAASLPQRAQVVA